MCAGRDHCGFCRDNDENFARMLIEKVHIKVLPRHYLSRETGGGQSGGNHVRIAMVADMAQCEEDVMYLKKNLILTQ